MISLVLLLVASMPWPGNISPTTKRDQALKQIQACRKSNEVSSRQCRNLNRNVDTLMNVYRDGDKSVLPVLFQFTYLRDFYDEAFLADPEGFLQTLSQLPGKQQNEVALGLAGGIARVPTRERFEAIRAALNNIPDSSHLHPVARLCLRTLETANASHFVDYFPPQTFSSRGADFQITWYSREMYSLGEKPLWPPSSSNPTVYRFTYIPAFTGPTMVALAVQPDGSGLIEMKVMSGDRMETTLDETASLSVDRMAEFLRHLDQAQFWTMSTESPARGNDGAEWILEGVQDGKYHTVVRWCPASYNPPAQDKSFADAVRALFELAGHKHTGGC